jgi:hypothetical protein
MLSRLGCRDLALEVAGGALGQALAKLGAAIDRREREFQNGSETLLKLSIS